MCIRDSFYILVVAYNPDGRISVQAVLKLERCANIKVLTQLQTSQKKLDKFKKRADFSLSDKSLLLSNLYTDLLAALKCIKSCVDDEKASLPPTWRNFLTILREPRMNLADIADQIEGLLASTTEYQKHPIESGKLHYNMSCFPLISIVVATGMEEVMMLNSHLESLCHELTDAENEETLSLREKLEAICDECQSAYRKLGEERREYLQEINQLKEEQSKLLSEIAKLEEDQGNSFNACFPHLLINVTYRYFRSSSSC